jgi:hypothetical protein
VSRRVWLVTAFVGAFIGPFVAALAACGKPGDRAPAGSGPASGAATGAAGSAGSATAPAEAGWHCAPLAFAASTPVPEASAAAWITVDGKPRLLVVGDSGNAGAYGIIDPETGATGETGKLPLSDEASDDFEGLAVRGDRIYGLTSSGWIQVWQRQGAGFARVGAPYPLAPVDLSDARRQHRPPDGDGMACSGRGINCGRNYEGLCLAPAPRTPGCIGFAASRADGHAYCLTEDGGKLAVHRERAIAVTRPGALADCAFGDDGALWLGSNLFDLGRVYRVAAWDEPAAARGELVGALEIGNPEVLAVRGDVVYRMSDMNGAPSAMARWRCTR